MRFDSTCLAGFGVAAVLLAVLWFPFVTGTDQGTGVATYYRGAIRYLEEEVQYHPGAFDTASRRPREEAVIQRSYHVSAPGLGLTMMASVPVGAGIFWLVLRGRSQVADARSKQSQHSRS